MLENGSQIGARELEANLRALLAKLCSDFSIVSFVCSHPNGFSRVLYLNAVTFMAQIYPAPSDSNATPNGLENVLFI